MAPSERGRGFICATSDHAMIVRGERLLSVGALVRLKARTPKVVPPRRLVFR